ncbi:hypothetical protein BRD56_03570 [Thermoplasmatales archaeon SW_10_69_26]|nr:MAG: hypothetical protein BRD56_03570 [Thermoplasmatales archaeon SW_10_69_26]
MIGSEGGSANGNVHLLATVLLLAAPLAGCAGGGGGGGGVDGDAMTAQDRLSNAESRAAEWSSDAEFIGTSITETTEGSAEEWSSEAFDFQADDNVGDGLSPQWTYTFEDGEGNLATVYMNVDGETHLEERQQDTFFMDAPVEDWSVSSADAVQAAVDADDEFASALESEDVKVGYLLAQGGGDKSWLLNAKTSDENVQMKVDADTGEAQRAGPSS